MFAVLYNKDLSALFRYRTTYPTTKWSLVRKAYEFDELSVTTKEIDNSSKAMYIGLHNDDGSLKYLAFCGKPSTKDGMSTYKGTDLRQIFKQQLALDLTNIGTSDGYETIDGVSVYLTRLQKIYRYLINACIWSLSYNGFSSQGVQAKVDVSDIGEHAPTWNENYIDRSPGISYVWDVLQAFNMMYDCYIETEVSIDEKIITFKVKRIYEEISFKLSDFNEAKVVNDTSVTNRVNIRVKRDSVEDDQYGSQYGTYYLYNDDTICTGVPDQDKLIYPPRTETVLEETSAKAIAKALEKLMDNRFKGKVEINTDCAMGYILKRIGLNTFGKIYGYNSADDSTYRRLPIMSISEDDSGKVKVSFGRLSQYWYAK